MVTKAMADVKARLGETEGMVTKAMADVKFRLGEAEGMVTKATGGLDELSDVRCRCAGTPHTPKAVAYREPTLM